jgi:2-polyprenyl-3-methyl-5-hydroxy-6-metoxy-1,4-benzoquinol methylase
MLQNHKREEGLLGHYNSNPSYYSSITLPVIETLIKKSRIDSLHNLNVLDIGCGDGRLLPMLENLGIKSYTGVDYSSVRTDIAGKIETNIQVDIITNSVQDFLNTNDKQFDIVFIFEVLEHLEQPELVIESLKKVCNNIIGSVPINMPYEAHLQVYRNINEVQSQLKCKVFHTNQKHFFLEV